MDPFSPLHVAYASAIALILFAGFKKARGASRLPTPPGPKGYPVIGNILDIPSKRQWEGYHELAKTYVLLIQTGDMIYLEAFGQSILVLSSLKRINDLFDKRSAIYSDKPRAPMIVELMNFKGFMGLIGYNDWWKRHRRAFQKHFAPNDLKRYYPVIMKHMKKYLGKLLNDPDDWTAHTRQVYSSLIIEITYGIETTSSKDPLTRDMTEVMDGFSVSCLPGRWLVDTFPILKYVPSWFPGAGFKRFAAYYSALEERTRNTPFNHVINAMRVGTASHSIALDLIEALPDPEDPARKEEEIIARNVAAVTHLAGTDTTLGVALTFYLLMALNPDIQQKAQKELDEVVGDGRLPSFDDREGLVYINAITKELLRFHQVTPMALPHATSTDDVYDGYFIPKGTIVMGNAWHIMHDPENFTDPMAFKPERYIRDGRIDETVLDAEAASFGFGRRICPGRQLSIESIFLTVASTLSVFDIIAPKDENGTPTIRYHIERDGAVLHPDPFEVSFVPRSKDVQTLLDS
ncbi:cytochrome P450 [Coprinopsis marcescibilis]|uniref:Cytochrome P450 n=1 Tax=Coprinopsis marcescibilis TaxID=230819 RepID=A0A5C3L5B9_COPMA|nr:cytochrome P450 [Coprinopsis marcescibilis]